MTSSTSNGTTIGITAGVPATFDAAGYGALAFTTIGGVESIPAFGATSSVNSFQPLNGMTEKNKGPANGGSIALPYAIDKTDAGQTLLATAADPANNARYYFVVTFPNGDKRFFGGKVFGAPETVGSATNVLMGSATIEIETKTVKVNAA
jgi:hypothetical protein